MAYVDADGVWCSGMDPYAWRPDPLADPEEFKRAMRWTVRAEQRWQDADDAVWSRAGAARAKALRWRLRWAKWVHQRSVQGLQGRALWQRTYEQALRGYPWT